MLLLHAMAYNVLKLIHVLSIIAWVGGMVFAHFALRPAITALEPPLRLRLMREVLSRFFRIVMAAVVLSVASGVWMIADAAQEAAATGGRFFMPPGWSLMASLGLVMALVFGFIRFGLYPRLDRAVNAANWQAAGAAMAGIRQWVALNLLLGVLAVAAVMLG